MPYTSRHVSLLWKTYHRNHVYPTLDEFGYVLPEADIQQKIEEQYDQCEKQCTIAVFLNDEEAMKTACIRAEWKPLEASNTLNKKEKEGIAHHAKTKTFGGAVPHLFGRLQKSLQPWSANILFVTSVSKSGWPSSANVPYATKTLTFQSVSARNDRGDLVERL